MMYLKGDQKSPSYTKPCEKCDENIAFSGPLLSSLVVCIVHGIIYFLICWFILHFIFIDTTCPHQPRVTPPVFTLYVQMSSVFCIVLMPELKMCVKTGNLEIQLALFCSSFPLFVWIFLVILIYFLAHFCFPHCFIHTVFILPSSL